MKVAITGAGGFLGNNLSHHLSQRGHEVFPIVRTAERARPFRASGMNARIGDVTDRQFLQSVFKEVQVVFHLPPSLITQSRLGMTITGSM